MWNVKTAIRGVFQRAPRPARGAIASGTQRVVGKVFSYGYKFSLSLYYRIDDKKVLVVKLHI